MEVVLESYSDMEAWEQIKPVLIEYANLLKRNIYVSNPHGSPSLPRGIPQRLYICFWSCPRNYEHTKLSTAFGEKLDIRCDGDASKPSGLGIVLYDPVNTPVAEYYKETLYVLFDLPHDLSGSHAGVLMRRIMEEYVRVILDGKAPKRRISQENLFLELFRNNNGILIMNPALIKKRWQDLLSVTNKKPVVGHGILEVVIGPIERNDRYDGKKDYGTFRVVFDVNSESVLFFPKSKAGKDHPRIDRDGNACLGNARRAMIHFIREREFVFAVELAKLYLEEG